MDEIKLEETEEIEETEIDELTEADECEPEDVATTKDENNEVAQAETAKLKDKKTFIHLHVHTEFSLLDGAARLTLGKKHPLLQACKAKNMPAIAITDHGVMYGVNLFYNYCIDEGIKPIIGCEFYTCEDMHVHSGRGDTNHLVLIAKNDIGYKNLVKLDSMAFLEGKYYKPRIDLNFLRQHSEGLICLSACLAGKIPRLLLQDDYEGAKAYALELKSIFAEGDFYIEIQDHGIAEQKATNPLLVKIAREIGVKVVATNDVHYINKKDAEMHDVLLCIQTGKTFNDTERMRFDGEEFYLKDYDEMYKLFSWCPESLQTPFEIVDKCDVHIKKENLMPPYTPEDGTTPEEYLRKLAYEGLEKRYGNPLSDEIKQRAEYELSVIIRMGFAEYYLIVWDFIDFARKNDIPVGAGRGSGVGSIIAYAIGITNVEPLRYNLLFERFLNPERVSNPDFDIDLCSEGREDVIKYVTKKYGADKVCQIITFGTMATKNAIKDVARVYEVPFDIVNKITKLIPMGKITIADVLGESGTTDKIVRELVEMYESDATIKKVLDMAKQIEGMPRQTGKHAAGVVICKEVISDFVPLQEKDGDVTTQYQKDEVEALGMLKMDFLGLRTLTDIKKAKHYITETTGTVVDFEQIGYADPEVYNLIGTGETDAVFQLESGGMKKFMRELMPKSLEDIIAGISLYRPGPMDSIPKYIESKNNPEKISYDHPLLEPILNMTYGCIVYQEQVMQVVQRLGGYTFGRADLLRRAMGKKKADVMKEEKSIFINGCAETKNSKGVCGAVANGVPE
ncbi:MAG: DNA polymerase III subunit alpha, partial [Clostridia bacterium]